MLKYCQTKHHITKRNLTEMQLRLFPIEKRIVTKIIFFNLLRFLANIDWSEIYLKLTIFTHLVVLFQNLQSNSYLRNWLYNGKVYFPFRLGKKVSFVKAKYIYSTGETLWGRFIHAHWVLHCVITSMRHFPNL